MTTNNEFLPFSRPVISQAAIDEVVDCLGSGWITTGPRVKQFEADLCAYLGAPHAMALTSATAGLHLAMVALGLQPDDEIITTSMTFVASLNTIVHAGAKPVLVDVDLETYNIDLDQVEDAITPRTRAIMPVHFAGLPIDLDRLYAIAKKHNVRVIEDAAHAIGSDYKGQRIGSFGDTQVFSFHPNKTMTTGEGGCVTTRDEAMVSSINTMRFHGIDREAWNRNAKDGSQHYDVILPGYKFNMMDIQASLGLHQLAALDGFIQRRTELAKRYLKAFADWPSLTLPADTQETGSRHSWHLFAPLINPEAAGINRDTFMQRMKDQNIGTGLHYQAAHLFQYYQDTFGYQTGQFPQAESIGSRIVSLPLFPAMTDADQDRVIEAMRTILSS